MPRFLTFGEVLLILQDQVRRYGGEYGVRDHTLLSSALAMPKAMYGGQLLHTGAFQQASAYAFHICRNHPFIDGNKRTALATALVFLELNGVSVSDPQEELYPLMMRVAEGAGTKEEIAKILEKLSVER